MNPVIPRLLLVTNLFCYPWDSNRGIFNQQQFALLGEVVDLDVLVAIPWPDAFRNFLTLLFGRRATQATWPRLKYFVYFYPPGFGYRFHPFCYFLSLILQRPWFLFSSRWDCLIGSWLYPDALAVIWLGRLLRIPVIGKAHGSDVNQYLEMDSRKATIVAGCKRLAGVMVVSQSLKSKLADAGAPMEKIKVIYNGVDHGKFGREDKHVVRSSMGISDVRRVVLFVGNLKVSKGIVDFLEAVSLLRENGRDFDFYVLGDAKDRGRFEKHAAALGISSCVHFMGKVAHEKLPPWFQLADLLCLPSHNEGVPNVVLEAMSCGLPVVATSVGGIPEIFDDQVGLLVDPHQPAALAKAISEVIDRRSDPARIREHSLRYEWSTGISSMLNLINHVTHQP